ncbi:hypothetical protein BCIN_07g00320 [Botrytis cinerea B05.10]|uniref:Secreted protein n=1 Tax=Botryotinia fuckeliana (strain B05.10) TaxID=332648 RepID=A0A384JLC0_BOTFB|nr:hypothetical protein BCIN_07g00320 [Botrytis cinerea B05.10]ATZ51389.1 hypothetical protein BCIN_07g00320 [Botrytis cinerea B05.10]
MILLFLTSWLTLFASTKINASSSSSPNSHIVSCLFASHIPQELPCTPSFALSIIPLNTRLSYTPPSLCNPYHSSTNPSRRSLRRKTWHQSKPKIRRS